MSESSRRDDSANRTTGDDVYLTPKQSAALEALKREGQAVVVVSASTELDSMDPEINVNTATALINKGLARFERDADGLILVAVKVPNAS